MSANRVRGAAITAIKNRYRHAWRKLEEAANHVAALEDRLSIEERWLPTDDAYREAASELAMRKYRVALDKLEMLVVQRLLELSKISMGGIGTGPSLETGFMFTHIHPYQHISSARRLVKLCVLAQKLFVRH